MTGLSFPAIGTFTVEVIDQVHTVAAILTGAPTALVHIEVAEVTLPAVRTEALERADPIDAGASVSTRIAHAVVYILVAIGSCKAELTGAGEVAARLADTAAMRTTHIRVDVSHTPI